MTWPSLLALSCALAMDAFAVSIASGLSGGRLTVRRVVRMASCFGLFQALMPVVGWIAGRAIQVYIAAFDHWVAFALLALVGARMLKTARGSGNGGERERGDPATGWALIVLGVATSIDALAVGLSLALIDSPIIVPAAVIGVVAAAFTIGGLVLGRRVGAGWGRRVETIGGIILIGIGVSIVVEHMIP